MPKYILISGSPRKGNTDYVLSEIYNNLKGSEIEYHYGTGFRYPTFNDLYWQPGGNPDLEPEKSWYQTIKYKLYLDDHYLNNMYDKITI